MVDDKNKKNHNDELYTITLYDQSESGEKIPERLYTSEKILANENRKVPPPVLTTSALIAKQAYFMPPVMQKPNGKKSFIESAREYADQTHEKTEHIPFMCYWPSYEYMSEAQLNWYFYMRDCIRNAEYIDTDLSYLFVYIYELINQVGVNNPDDGLEKIINIWINYRRTYNKLDRYLIDWTGDYINFYRCNADRVFDLLKKEGLFLLMPTDMLADYYFKNNLLLPIELITRFCDYKFYESEFIKGENGNLFTDYLSGLVNDIRCHMAQEKEGSFEKRDILISSTQQHKKLPFQRAIFHNPENIRIEAYLPYEQHKPFRYFLTAVIKEFENQLRILTKYKGRLRPDKLPDEIISLCIKHARDAFNGTQQEQKVEITIDRERLLALIQDSDEVRKRLIEGNYEYDGEFMTETQPTVAIVPAKAENNNSLQTNLEQLQQKILDFLLSKGGNSSTGELSSAFPGVLVGVEIDKINSIALDVIGDLLIGFENESWYIVEDYINDI